MSPTIEDLPLSGLKLIHATPIPDERGYFLEAYSRPNFAALGVDHWFLQDNESKSRAIGTVRGLHFQVPPFAQTKLVRVLRGKILDVAVDIRRSSPTYGHYFAVELREGTGTQLLVPIGFAHGFCTTEKETVVFYKVDNVYSAAHERGICWNDPALNIEWPVASDVATISAKDRALPEIGTLPVYFE